MILFQALKFIHVLCVVLWVGGMLFAHFALRPAVATLEPPVRLRLLNDVMGRFFHMVLWAALLTLVSGFWMIGNMASQAAQTGGQFRMPSNWTIMASLGILMVAIFGHIRFALFKRMSRAVGSADWKAAGAAMASIRKWVAINLGLGVLVIAVAILG